MTASIYLSLWKYSICLFLLSFQTSLGFSSIHLSEYYLGAILVRFLMPIRIDWWTCVLFYNKFHWLLSVSWFSLSSFFRSSSFQVRRFPHSSFFRLTSFQVDLKTWNTNTLKSYIPSFLYNIWFCLYRARIWVLIVSDWNEIMAETLNISNSWISPICLDA